MAERVLVWFRRDLRLSDNTAFRHALESGSEVVPVFILDRGILGRETVGEARRRFLRTALEALDAELRDRGCRLLVRGSDDAVRELNRVAHETESWALYYNRDFTPYARMRDTRATRGMQMTGLVTMSFDDQLLVPPFATMDDDGQVPKDFEEFSARWLPALELDPSAGPEPAGRLAPASVMAGVLEEWPGAIAGATSDWPGATPAGARALLLECVRGGLGANSRLSAALKFGTISVREVARAALAFGSGHPENQPRAEAFITRLARRDHAAHMVFADPTLVSDRASSPSDGPRLEAWREGRTGIPMVDAGMRQLLAQGFIGQDVRRLVASFLAHHLECAWQEGERHFRRHLVDADIALNRLGWLQALAEPVDPVLEGRRIDPSGEYTRRWVPELRDVDGQFLHSPWDLPGAALMDYPQPIVPASLPRGRHHREED
jgi:deoxyribodipyrimidine photo-lyase